RRCGPEHRHRPRQLPREHDAHQEHLARPSANALAPRPRHERLQHTAAPRHRHGGEFPHLWPGRPGGSDALHRVPDEAPVLIRTTAVLAAAALAVPPAPAGAAQAAASAPTFESSVALVRVTVVVRDKSGALVRGLKREDFSIVEDDKPQTIEAFE